MLSSVLQSPEGLQASHLSFFGSMAKQPSGVLRSAAHTPGSVLHSLLEVLHVYKYFRHFRV